MTTELKIDSENLAGFGIFAELDKAIVDAVVLNSQTETYPAGTLLFEAGDSYQNALFILYDGEMELVHSQRGRRILNNGALLGLSNYLDNAPYASTARATTDSIVLKLPADKLRKLENDFPPLFNALNHVIAERIRARSAFTLHPVGGTLSMLVRSVMKSPISTCVADISLKHAFQTMQERQIGSLVVLDQKQELLGILTCSGISEALALKGASPQDSVMHAACEEPKIISADAPLWQADEMLDRTNTKYLMVMEQQKPVGMISQSDILHALIEDKTILSNNARDAHNLEELHRLYTAIHDVAKEARERNRLASQAVRVLSHAHRAIQQRCVELTLDAFTSAGNGPAPRGFALLIMGSGGREEMLLNPDQDNGIIIADAEEPLSQDENQWFADFTQALNQNLATAGYVLCLGKIMANNPMFRKTLAEWKRQISHMTRHPTEKAARWSNIVFDFDTFYGDDALTQELRTHLLGEFKKYRLLLDYMVDDDAEGRPPLGFFNQLVTTGKGEDKGKIDIKRNGIRIICDAARIYGLSAGIQSCNTTDRLKSLVRQGVLSADLVDSVTAAYEELLDLLLEHQIKQQQAGIKPDKMIAPEQLSPYESSALRVAMRVVKRFQDQLQGQFGRAAF